MNTHSRPRNGSGGRFLGIALPLTAFLALAAAPIRDQDACTQWAAEARTGCKKAASADYWIQRAKCSNLPTAQERLACRQAALDDLKAALKECGDQYHARVDLCDDLGGGIYAPQIDPTGFVPVIDNPYLPLLPGTTYVYEKQDEDGTEHIEVTVTDDTKVILGVTCTAVRDTVSVDGEIVEDTTDWFAQDAAGNVWYFGEISMNFEDGQLVSLGGSWKAGEDGAQPGIVMEAAPAEGDVYRQEFLIGEAEDAASVLSLDASVTVAYGTFANCVQTADFTPLSPDALEHKFYAAGVGLVLELDPETGERTELVDIRYE